MKVKNVIDLRNATEQDLALIDRTEESGNGRFVYLVLESAITVEYQEVTN